MFLKLKENGTNHALFLEYIVNVLCDETAVYAKLAACVSWDLNAFAWLYWILSLIPE